MQRIELETNENFDDADERRRVDSEAIKATFTVVPSAVQSSTDHVDKVRPRGLCSLIRSWCWPWNHIDTELHQPERNGSNSSQTPSLQLTQPLAQPNDKAVDPAVPLGVIKQSIWDTANSKFGLPGEAGQDPRYMPIKTSSVAVRDADEEEFKEGPEGRLSVESDSSGQDDLVSEASVGSEASETSELSYEADGRTGVSTGGLATF